MSQPRDPVQENAILVQKYNELRASLDKMAADVPIKFAPLLKERSALKKRADELEAANAQLTAELASQEGPKAVDVAALSPEEAAERTRLIAQINRMNAERQIIHEKVKAKLQALVVARYEADLRVKYLRKKLEDITELKSRRRQVNDLLAEQTLLSNQLAALQNKLQGEKTNQAKNALLLKQIQATEASLAEDKTRFAALTEALAASNHELTQGLPAKIASLKEAEAAFLSEMAQEKTVKQEDSSLATQNKFLRNEVQQYIKETARLEAMLSGRKDAREGRTADLLAGQHAQCAAACADLSAQIEETKTETARMKSECQQLHEEVEARLVENKFTEIEIKKVTSKNQATVASTAALRKKLLQETHEKTNILMELEELIGTARQVEDIDRQNDQLRMQLQEVMDHKQQLVNRIKVLQTPVVVTHEEVEAEEEAANDKGGESVLGWAARFMRNMRGASKHKEEEPEPEPEPEPEEAPESSSEAASPIVNMYAMPEKMKRRTTDLANLEGLLGGTKGRDLDGMLKNIERSINDEVAAAANGGAPPLPARRRATAKLSDFAADETIRFLERGNKPYPQIHCATLERLVERLTFEKFPDMDFTHSFLLTYRSFTTAPELLEFMLQRYCTPVPKNLSAAEQADFKKTMLCPIRLRVVNVLKAWVQVAPQEFEEPKLRAQLTEVLDMMRQTGSERSAESIERALQAKSAEVAESLSRHHEYFEAPMSVDISGILSMSLLDMNPEAIAVHLTVLESRLYCAIQPWECVSGGWNGKDRAIKAPNITRAVTHFNSVSSWVFTQTVTPDVKPKDRAKYITWMINLGTALQKLNNFNGVMEIVSGLSNVSIKRLHKAWQKVEKRPMAAYEAMRDIVSNNRSFKAMKGHLAAAKPPSLPYLGMYLSYFTFIEEGNPPKIDGMINFVRRQLTAEIIREIQQYQVEPYDLPIDPVLYAYVRRLPFASEDDMYDLSIIHEPLRKA